MEDANESKKIRIIGFQFDLYREAPLNRNHFMNLMWSHMMAFEFQYYCWPTHNYRIYWEMILSRQKWVKEQQTKLNVNLISDVGGHKMQSLKSNKIESPRKECDNHRDSLSITNGINAAR